MKVIELIEALNDIEDKNIEVLTEGCDCWGDAVSVEVRYDSLEDKYHVLIKREE